MGNKQSSEVEGKEVQMSDREIVIQSLKLNMRDYYEIRKEDVKIKGEVVEVTDFLEKEVSVLNAVWMNRAVGVKRFDLSLFNSSNVRLMERCCVVSSSVSHPNIVRFYGMYEDFENDSIGVVCENTKNNLRIYLKEKLKIEKCLGIINDICTGFHYLSERRFLLVNFGIHDIFIENNLRVYLDFFSHMKIVSFVGNGLQKNSFIVLENHLYKKYRPPEFENHNVFSLKMCTRIMAYLFGIIILEVMTRKFESHRVKFTKKEKEFMDEERVGLTWLWKLQEKLCANDPVEQFKDFNEIVDVIQSHKKNKGNYLYFESSESVDPEDADEENRRMDMTSQYAVECTSLKISSHEEGKKIKIPKLLFEK